MTTMHVSNIQTQCVHDALDLARTSLMNHPCFWEFGQRVVFKFTATATMHSKPGDLQNPLSLFCVCVFVFLLNSGPRDLIIAL